MIVIGDSDFRDQVLVNQELDDLQAKNPIAWVITGGDRHLECFAWEWARQNKVDVYRYYPKWNKHGRGAGAEVGRRMLRAMFDPKMVLAFLAERGNATTAALINRADKLGIEVVMIRGGTQARPEIPPEEEEAQVMQPSSPVAPIADDVPWTRPRPAATAQDDDDDLPPWAGKRGR